jgi:hypothetical protein
MNRMPAIEYEIGPCPTCGAANAEQANLDCRPTSDETGEVWCEMTDAPMAPDGSFMVPTAASLARIDDWCDEQATTE